MRRLNRIKIERIIEELQRESIADFIKKTEFLGT